MNIYVINNVSILFDNQLIDLSGTYPVLGKCTQEGGSASFLCVQFVDHLNMNMYKMNTNH